jgi:hypothetical protein
MKQTFGLLAGVSLFLCAASNTHADTVKAIGASSILDAQRTLSETTSVFFDADSQPHTPSNPTTSTLIIPVAVPLLNADRQDGPDVSVPTQAAPQAPPDNVPVDPPMPTIGSSSAVSVLVALGLAPQLQESGPSTPTFANPLPPAILLFGTALVGLSVLGRGRLKQ